ncbi:MAG TPA: hypothetical protein RMH99_22505, partial [Sandaracinaceae bacterium LLY-WYZ-13_1]|nr:hypothetical protein [Sandaracinaceae bacterium LLY-WYZ-13_1]
MSGTWQIYCDEAELAVECARAAERSSIAVEPEIVEDALVRARMAVADGGRVALALASAPEPGALVRLAQASRAGARAVPMAVVTEPEPRRRARWLGGDLGLVAVGEIGPLLAAMALLDASAPHPWTASTRALEPLDRVRLGDAVTSGRGGGRLVRVDDGRLGWTRGSSTAVVVGLPRDVGKALRALRTRDLATP